jgi:lysophospholipase L1-like esterase
MKQVKRILKIMAVNAVLFIVGIVVIELMFGGWLDTRRLNRLNILKDCELKYDLSNLYKDPNQIITYSRDKYGLRGTHSTPDSIDILTVGGSTTDQRYIRDGETWQDVLQQRFEQTGVTVIVANAGVDGQSTFGHIKNFKWWFPHIPGLAPDFILYYIGLNDFHKDAGYSYDDLLDGDKSFNLMRNIKENSALWNFYRTLRGAWEATVVKKIGHRSIDFEVLQWTRQALQDDYKFMQPRLKAYADRLRILADLTHDFGAKPIFVFQPTRKYRITPDGIEGISWVSSYEDYEINGVDYYHMIRQFNRVTEAIAKRKGALFVDLMSHANWADTHFYDFGHMTPQGAEKVGTLLSEALRSVIPRVGQTALPNKK